MEKTGGFLKKNWAVIIGSSAVTLAVVYGIVGGERALSTTRFCTSCHSMSYPYEELKESTHYGSLGANPGCGDCHLPPQFYLRVESHVVDGARELVAQFIHDYSTEDKFNERRAEIAHIARTNLRKWDSRPCRVCHKSVKPSSDEAEREHRKMQTEGATCIDCHQNLVHEEVPEEDIVAGMREGKIVLKKEGARKKKPKKEEKQKAGEVKE